MMPRSTKRVVECQVIQPDKVLYSFGVPENCKGQDCLNKMCDILGIVEKDYFGLLYQDRTSGCSLWMNNRLRVNSQLKSRPPYRLRLGVKYFVEPEILLQTSSMEVFCKEAKLLIKEEAILVPESRKGIIGACLAQVDFGDQRVTSAGVPILDYPAYFPEWQGTLHAVINEHQKLKGTPHVDAMRQLLQNVINLETCGMTWASGQVDGQAVVGAIGSYCILIYDLKRVCLYKFPYYMLTQVSYGNSFFAFNYHTVDANQHRIEKKMRVFVTSKKLAQHMFRTVTEKQTFFVLPTVMPHILKHAKERSSIVKRIGEVFGMKFEKKFYYDVVRTKMEAYSLSWQLLHELSQREMDDVVGVVHPSEEALESADPTGVEGRASSTVSIVNSPMEVLDPTEGATGVVNPPQDVTTTEEITAIGSAIRMEYTPSGISIVMNAPQPTEAISKEEEEHRQKSLVCWGLSQSSCNLAKLLLSEPQLHLTDSERTPLGASTEPLPQEERKETLEPLTDSKAQVLRQLLIRIQERNVCRVCMDELISSVFCPCGHRVSCYGCAKRVVRCPLCRTPVGYVQYIHGSKA